MLATGKVALSFVAGLIVRPSFNLFFLMYSHTFFVTSVRANDLAPQIAAKASLRLFFAKMPLPAFFMASAFFSAFIFFNAAFVIVVFFVVVVGTVVFVVVVIA